MCPIARSRRDIYNEHVTIEKICKICLQTPKYCQTRINEWCNKPGLPVYIGLVYLFTHAWSTCLPRPGQPVYPGLECFQDMGTPSKTFILHRFRHLWGPQTSRLSPSDPLWKVSMTHSIFSQIHNTVTQKVMFEVLEPWKSYLYMLADRFGLDLGGFIEVWEGVEARQSDILWRAVAGYGILWQPFAAEFSPFK